MADPRKFPYQHPAEFFHSIEQNDASITEVTLVSGNTSEADAEAIRLGKALVKNIENSSSSPSHITTLKIENHLLHENEALVSHIDAYLGPILYFLRHSPSLRIVSLRHLHTAWAVVLQALSDNPHVRNVSVQGLSFDDPSIAWDIRHVKTLQLMACDGPIGNAVLSTATDRLQTLVLHSLAEDPEPIFLEALQHLAHLRSLALKSCHTMVPAAATGRILRQIATCVPHLQDLSLEYFCIKSPSEIQAPCLSMTKCAVGSVLPRMVRSLTLNMVRVMEEEDDGTENGTAAGNEDRMIDAEEGPTNDNDTPPLQHNCITRFLANTTTAAGVQTTTLDELHWDMQPWSYRPTECQHLFQSTLPLLTSLRKLRVHYLDANEAVVLARQLPGLRHLQALVVERISHDDGLDETAVPAAFAKGLYENSSLLQVQLWHRRTVPLLSAGWVERCCTQRNRHLPTLLLRRRNHATTLFPSLVQTAFETPATGISMVVASLLQWE